MRRGAAVRARRWLPPAALVLVAVQAAQADTFERPIQFAQPGKVVVLLDRDVYERARHDLADLRVLDARGQQVPYLLERARDAFSGALESPRVLNRAFVRGESSSLTLDFGRPLLKSELVLSLGGDNFRRRVTVEGRNQHEVDWETMTDTAFVFAVPPPAAARYETVALPENNFQFLKVTVHNGPDDVRPVEIHQVWARPQERRRPREQEMPLRFDRREDEQARETQLVADLGARYQPFRALVLAIEAPQFFRGVVVEAREESAAAGEALRWYTLAEGSVYRYLQGGVHQEKLRLDVPGRARHLRLRIRNRDDRPLRISGLSVVSPVERLVFEAATGQAYRLSYGDPKRDAPAYDIERTVGDAALWIAQAGEGRLAGATRVERPAGLLPWTERYPGAVWAGLLLLVAMLGAATWRALRAAQ